MSLRADVVVAGGGISGLAAAHSARKAGATVILLEASAGAGGVMQTNTQSDFLIEHGPTSMAATSESLALIDDLGLTNDVIEPPKTAARRYVVRDAKMHALPSSPASLFRSELLTPFGKMRLLAEPLIRRRAETAPEESLAEIVRRRFGREVLDYFVDPFVSGVCAGDPEKLSARHVLRILAELERVNGSVLKGAIKRAKSRKGKREGHIVSFKRGMQQLPDAFQQALEHACVFDARLTGVEETNNQFELLCEIGGRSETIVTDNIVCALPSHALASVSWPAPWRQHLDRMSAVPYAPICTVALGFRREDVAHPLDGFGVLMPSSERRGILGALFNSSMFAGRAGDGRVLVTAFVGGARMRAVGPNSAASGRAFTDDDCRQAAIAELTPLLGISGPPLVTSVSRWEQGIPQLEVGHQRVINAALAIEIGASGAFFTGSYLSGAAVGDCLAHGALIGARAAARALHIPAQPEKILARP